MILDLTYSTYPPPSLSNDTRRKGALGPRDLLTTLTPVGRGRRPQSAVPSWESLSGPEFRAATRPPGSSTSSPTVPVTRDPERCLLLLSPISLRELGAETSDCYTAYHSLCTKFKKRDNSCAVRNPSSNHLLAGEGIAWKGARRGGLSMVLKRPRAELSNWCLRATLYVLKSELNK